MNYILLNRIKTPDRTVLTSRHRYDYRAHKDKNGCTYMVDGGLDYLRRNSNKTELNLAQRLYVKLYEALTKKKWKDPLAYEELSVYSDAPFEIVRDSFEWGTYGKNGDKELQWVKLKDMSAVHIKACLKMFGLTNQFVAGLMKQELKFRKNTRVVK